MYKATNKVQSNRTIIRLIACDSTKGILSSNSHCSHRVHTRTAHTHGTHSTSMHRDCDSVLLASYLLKVLIDGDEWAWVSRLFVSPFAWHTCT